MILGGAEVGREGFDNGAAVTRSLLGWGVVAGPFYVVVGLVLAFSRPGFDLSRHALSLLTLGEHGWAQRANLVLTGLMVLAAAVGAARALREGRGGAIAAALGIFGIGLVGSAIALPDPVAGFPPGSPAPDGVTTHGLLHLALGAIGFLALAVGALTASRWRAGRGERAGARVSLALGLVVLLGFLGGAALATSGLGVALLWLAVLAGFAWVALISVRFYRHVPHPVLARRTGTT
ncbi:DUF998 domain-containing protein [Kineococcus gynurae]|uniref:DUF998 domain-containing protein n=1 Tax=Kineococcus gynurae TaxID=452979 RepID=A0ABV5LW94_9ACTN